MKSTDLNTRWPVSSYPETGEEGCIRPNQCPKINACSITNFSQCGRGEWLFAVVACNRSRPAVRRPHCIAG